MLQQVPHRQALLHIVGGVDLPTRADGKRLALHHRGSEGNVSRNHQIMRGHMMRDVLIDGIRFRRHAHERH